MRLHAAQARSRRARPRPSQLPSPPFPCSGHTSIFHFSSSSVSRLLSQVTFTSCRGDEENPGKNQLKSRRFCLHRSEHLAPGRRGEIRLIFQCVFRCLSSCATPASSLDSGKSVPPADVHTFLPGSPRLSSARDSAQIRPSTSSRKGQESYFCGASTAQTFPQDCPGLPSNLTALCSSRRTTWMDFSYF